MNDVGQREGRKVHAAVVGAGSWGTALARLLRRNGHDVSLWSYEAEVARAIRDTRENPAYLPGVELPHDIRASHELADVVTDAELVLSVSPSQFVGRIMEDAARHLHPDALVVSASKGIEVESLRRMDEVLTPLLSQRQAERLVVLSGPSFAAEVARDEPTAVVAAGRSRPARLEVQRVFRAPSFRVYTNPDIIGVELGGALKNVIALASGVVSGLGFGHNARAALITRGLAEMTRLGVAMGARAATFSGLSGMGDLVLTCTGELSRNRSVGHRIGQGEAVADILGGMTAVAEGVRTTPAVHRLAERHGIEMPITREVDAILDGKKKPEDAVRDLMLREPKPESWGLPDMESEDVSP